MHFIKRSYTVIMKEPKEIKQNQGSSCLEHFSYSDTSPFSGMSSRAFIESRKGLGVRLQNIHWFEIEPKNTRKPAQNTLCFIRENNLEFLGLDEVVILLRLKHLGIQLLTLKLSLQVKGFLSLSSPLPRLQCVRINFRKGTIY